MTEFTRRSVLTGAVAASVTALASGVPSPGRAAAPLANAQAPGFYRYKVGSFEITVINDGAKAQVIAEMKGVVHGFSLYPRDCSHLPELRRFPSGSPPLRSAC